MISEEAINAFRVKMGMLTSEEIERREMKPEEVATACGIEDLDAITSGKRFATIEEMIRLADHFGETLGIRLTRQEAHLYELTEAEWRTIRALRAGSMVEFAMYLGVMKHEQMKDYLPRENK